jgi:hypothetical protein
VQVSQALNPRRIARSLVTVFVLSLIQTVVPPVVAPIVSVPDAKAVDVAYANATGGTDVVVPAGVFSITLTARGGAGGTGGNDSAKLGLGSSDVGYAAGTFPVSPGDRITIYPGGAGGNGSTQASGTGGGAAGAASIPTNANVRTPSVKFNNTFTDQLIVNGGSGGPAGSGGSSGAGGGGGAASIVLINEDVALVAGGGGGGAGGSGPGAQPTTTHTETVTAIGANGINGGTCGSTDGGGTGGGGGGWLGGAAGVLDRPGGTGECRAFGGSRGTNFVASSAITPTNTYITPSGAGFVTYDFIYSATTACATNSQTVDIYTVVRVTTTANCTWTVPASVSTVDLFLVGGGGGGAGDGGPGGNGGFGTSRTAVPVNPNSTMTLKVGYGGAESNWGFFSNAFYGDSTTVVTSTGALYYALGGATNGNNPSAAATAVQTAQNGSFAGGKGGDGAGCFNVGTAGKRGISNYFYGTLNTYGGGGGAGSCPNGAATTPAAGADGGGAGGYASSSSVNQPGSNGTNGTGGGGGGGTATGSGLKLPGGKGGSGVILIRYATDSANAFPATLASSLSARWVPDGLQVLDANRESWIDASGTNASVASGNIIGSPVISSRGTTDGASSTASSKTLLTVSGTPTDNITLVNLPTNYTMFHIARYRTTGSKGRLITTNTGNWLSGHHGGRAGLTHHNSWLTPEATHATGVNSWVLSTDQLKQYRVDGLDVSYSTTASQNAQSTSTGFGVNNSNYNEKSDFDVADIVIFNRILTNGEIRAMEQYLARIYGLTIRSTTLPTETDTALSMSGGQYLYTHIGYGEALNDTFTAQAWIRAGTQCGAGGGARCVVFARENGLMFGVYNGYFYYLLHGTNTTWDWIDTTYLFPINEWHHVSVVKRGIANTNGAIELYLDGQLVYTKAGSPYRPSTASVTFASSDIVRQTEDAYTYIGARLNEYDRFYGNIDEVKVWRVARTVDEIKSDMHSNDASHRNLMYYWDFNKRVGTIQEPVTNLAYFGVTRGDLVPATSIPYVEVATRVTSAPYTTITFPRSYITQSGGWKVPESVTAATTIVVGGGGGAGKSDSNMSAPGGAGGGGGVTYSPTQGYTPGDVVQVRVGVGGLAGRSLTNDASLRNGTSSFLGIGAGLTALGGGGGGSNGFDGAGGSTVATGGGGGGSPAPASSCSMLGFNGGTVPSGYNGAQGGWGWGGLGGSSRGAATTSGCYGVPGNAFVDPITSVSYGYTGSNQFHSTWNADANYSRPNNGWGGSVAYGGTADASGIGRYGSSGVVVIRYITPFKPVFTPPTNAYLNVGMTETFTTNVAQDSATVGLTRTFRWESTTAGSGGTFTPIKVGTGAANAAFSWVPTDTSTSGSQYLYRVVVTDSDTAGLFIVDTSTAVFAVINPALRFSSTSTSIRKTLNLAQSETFTISLGTPTYRYSLSPVLPGVTIETNTAGVAVLRIAETATVGTYIETLTVTDSVSATLSIPITLNISAPPSLTAIGEVVKNYQVLHLDASNRWSVQGVDGVATNGLIWRDQSGTRRDALTNNASPINSTSCKAPVFTTDNGGAFNFNGTDTCYYTPYLGTQFQSGYTIETWIRPTSSSIPSGTQILSQMYDTGGEQISLVIGALDVGNGNIYVGFYSGNGWRYANFPITPVANTWMHIAGTYDGNTLRTYLNGVLLGSSTYTTFGSTNLKGYFIGKRWDGAYFYTGAIGEVRAYSVPLSDTQVVQNFNATRYRFDSSNLNILKPSQKYGSITLESFTVTSGGETETLTFAIGNRSGIAWDTSSTPGQIKLTVQETLTPGTYFDTITATDNFGTSTNLPIRFTVTKADTLTIFIDTPTALNYTGNRALFTPNVRTLGAVGFESGTALTPTVRFKPAGTTCATGGYCRVGDIGPGGGIVFIDTSTASSDGRIYEVAPQNWSGSDDLSTVSTYCSNNSSSIGASQSGIGWGETNTTLARNSCLGGAVARVNSFNQSNSTGYSDWFIPSRNEAIELAKIPATAGLLNIGSNWTVGNSGYWSSTESNTTTMWSIGHVGPVFNGNTAVLKSESAKNMVRPVRAFRACWAIDTCTALLTTETPTAAGIYMISPTSGASAATLAERYSSIRYVESRLTINRIAQRAQVIPFINVNFPDTFTVNVMEGNGNGAVTYTANNLTSTGCGFDYKKLYAATQGTCTITVYKAGDRNYLPDTATAGMYLLTFVNNQPSAGVGSGPNIALSGQTSVTVDPNVAPTITSLSTYTAQAGVTQIVITGVGFDSANLAGITVKFWRNIVASGFTVNAQNTEITVTVPAGATTGKVLVTTPNGQAVSEFALTITP